MSSGKRAGPAATYEDRNPFDISRRSEKDVAMEIAQRMAAWKKARGRSFPPSSATPVKERNTPPIAAPVQPPRLPSRTEAAGQPSRPSQMLQEALPRESVDTARSDAEISAPLFATVSRQRAMPPAPSLKPPAVQFAPVESRLFGQPAENAARATDDRPLAEPLGVDATTGETEAVPATAAEAPDRTPRPLETSNIDDAGSELATIEAAETSVADPTRQPPDAEARSVELADMERPRLGAPVPAAEADDISASALDADTLDSGEPALAELDSAIRSIDARDEMSGRREPTLDAPSAETHAPIPAKSDIPSDGSRLKPSALETRIEPRRIEILRADPQFSVRRPIFPRVDLAEWEGPPTAVVQVQRARSGAGWAIGLGAALLLIGVTAPAALWQHGRQDSSLDQDRIAMTPVPAPSTPPDQAATPVPAPATAPSKPQPEASPPAPPAPSVQASSLPAAKGPPVETKPEAGEMTSKEQMTLGAVRNGGALNEAPIVPPPQEPRLSVQSPANPGNTKRDSSGANDLSSLMVARPFVPEHQPQPFVPAARAEETSTGSVSVPPATDQSAAIGPKPTLTTKPKPTAAAAPTASRTTRNTKKQRPQTLDQMFQTLIDTLSDGQPARSSKYPPTRSDRH
ncbi:MAG: hypothetical protein R3D05_08750 [Dongiaceae bacterium]